MCRHHLVRNNVNSSGSLSDALEPSRLAPRNVVPQGLERFVQSSLPMQNDVEYLSPRVICVLGQNPSNFTLNGTNIFIVGTGKRRILIDAGEARPKVNQVIALLAKVFVENGIEGLDEIICTHLHHDHVGGAVAIAKKFGPCRISKYPSPKKELERRQKLIHEEQKRLGITDVNSIPKSVFFTWLGLDFELNSGYHRLQEGDCIKTEGASLRILFTPGHAPDHVVIWLEEERSLFTGDHILGWGTSWVDDLSQYMDSLVRIQSLNAMRLFPGHGPAIYEARMYVDKYISHRIEREAMVVKALAQQNGGPLSSQVLAERLYPDRMDSRAIENVEKILFKLKQDLVVQKEEVMWSLL